MLDNENKQIEILAVLHSASAPTEVQKEKLVKYIESKYRKTAAISWNEDTTLGGGFKLELKTAENDWNVDEVYDWSLEGQKEQISEILHNVTSDTENVISLLRESVENWTPATDSVTSIRKTGTVVSVGDGIATLSGLADACYGEILTFSSGVKGMVQELSEDKVGCILFGDDEDILEGSLAKRTGKSAGIPVGDAFIGRVVDALGAPIDGKGNIKADGYRPIENPAPQIIDRQPVNEPMETGLLAIDSMFPIGRGQRELIIGDRQTGKTAIALDTIINQKGKNVICIYVAIGQKASSVAQLTETLRKTGAMDYSIVVCATASDSAPLQYIAPYAGCALGEYFMNKGKDVLIVYDDLSKHAIAYRAMSLLLERSPGREAYPGDVFYLHSRLLERSAHLSDELGGGSMTALPIVETQAGDVSAYIPTNIISITDGQIFLESNLFFAGQRPAVNVGLSVSRVGGAAQTQAMKKAAGTIRLALAQYREIEVFTQFSSDLDESTKNQLTFGQGLMQLLKQEQYHPFKQYEQVITLLVALNNLHKNVPVEKISELNRSLLAYMKQNLSDICSDIEVHGILTDEAQQVILETATIYIASSLEQGQ